MSEQIQLTVENPRDKEFDALYQQVIKVILDAETDPEIKIRKQEILQDFAFEEYLINLDYSAYCSLQRDLNGRSKDKKTFTGFIFEHLVNSELYDDEENSLIANFVVRCLRNVEILGLDKALVNPDHIGVVVDQETGKAYITGLYEVKLKSVIDDRIVKQLEFFYKSLKYVIKKLNEDLAKLKERYDLKFIPEDGVELMPESEIYKFMVVPKPINDLDQDYFQRKAIFCQRMNWQIKKSLFSRQDILTLHKFVVKFYKEKQQEIEKQKRLKGLEKVFKKEEVSGQITNEEKEQLRTYIKENGKIPLTISEFEEGNNVNIESLTDQERTKQYDKYRQTLNKEVIKFELQNWWLELFNDILNNQFNDETKKMKEYELYRFNWENFWENISADDEIKFLQCGIDGSYIEARRLVSEVLVFKNITRQESKLFTKKELDRISKFLLVYYSIYFTN